MEKKELNILHSRFEDGLQPAITIFCIQSDGHEGEHEWHLWTDAENSLQKTGKGLVMKVVKFFPS